MLEVLQDGFGFLRSPEANYLPGADDIYVSPDMIRQYSLRTGDTVEGVIQEPNDAERYFALVSVEKINFEDPEKARHKVAFDNLTRFIPMNGSRWRSRPRRRRRTVPHGSSISCLPSARASGA